MKVKKLLLLAFLFILMISTVVFATEVKTDDDLAGVPMPISEEDGIAIEDGSKIIDNDYFVCENDIKIKDISVMGNLFIVSKNATVSNVIVSGSVFVVAQSVELTNVQSEGSLYLVAEEVRCEQSLFKNTYTASKTIELLPGTLIRKNIYAYAQDCTYNATANNDVGIFGENIEIGSDAVIGQNLNISSKEEPEIPQSARFGDYNFQIIKDSDDASVKEFDLGEKITKVLAYIITTVILALVIIKCMPNFKNKVQSYNAKKLVVNALFGLLFVFAIPVLSIFLMTTGFGLRLGFITLLLYILAFMIATPISCILIALLICKKQNKEEEKFVLLYVAITSFIVSILGCIPTLSAIVTILLGLVGFGTIFVLPMSKVVENEK